MLSSLELDQWPYAILGLTAYPAKTVETIGQIVAVAEAKGRSEEELKALKNMPVGDFPMKEASWGTGLLNPEFGFSSLFRDAPPFSDINKPDGSESAAEEGRPKTDTMII